MREFLEAAVRVLDQWGSAALTLSLNLDEDLVQVKGRVWVDEVDPPYGFKLRWAEGSLSFAFMTIDRCKEILESPEGSHGLVCWFTIRDARLVLREGEEETD